MSTLKRRLNKLEEDSTPKDRFHTIVIGYTEDKQELLLRKKESYEELEASCGGTVNGHVCFVMNYRGDLRWNIPN